MGSQSVGAQNPAPPNAGVSRDQVLRLLLDQETAHDVVVKKMQQELQELRELNQNLEQQRPQRREALERVVAAAKGKRE